MGAEWMIDYTRFELGRGQRIRAVIIGCATSWVAAWLIYRHAIAAVLLAPAGLWYPAWLRVHLRGQRQQKMRLHFKEMLQTLAPLLSAGRSVENAILSLEKELALTIADPRSDLLLELRILSNRIRNGEAMEVALQDFAIRSGLEEIRHFADAIAVCKRAGGDLIEVVRSTSTLLNEKLEVELDIAVMMAQKRFESRIMMVMPFALIGFLGWFAPDYMAPLRQGAGMLLLTGCLLLLGLVCWWMAAIMKIEI
jgi:tight adherence protein B